MLKIFKYLNFTDADVAKFDNETMQMAALIEGFQSVYSTTPDTSAKKNALAATIAESIRILLKRIYSVQGLDPRVKENIKDEMAKLPNSEEPNQQQQPQQQTQKTKPQQPEPKQQQQQPQQKQQQQQKEEPKQQQQQQQQQTKIKIGDKFYFRGRKDVYNSDLIYKIEGVVDNQVIVGFTLDGQNFDVNMEISLPEMQQKFDEGIYELIVDEPKQQQQQQQEPEPEPKKEEDLSFKVGDIYQDVIGNEIYIIEEIDLNPINNFVTVKTQQGDRIYFSIYEVEDKIEDNRWIEIELPQEEPKKQEPAPQQQQPEPKPKKQRAKKQKPSQEPEEVDFTESELQEAIDGLELLEDMSEDIQNELARLREKIINIQSKI